MAVPASSATLWSGIPGWGASAPGISNDNLAAHEMPELKNAPRQPAAEAVIHYTRFSAIGAAPAHPSEAAAIAVPPPVDISLKPPLAAPVSLKHAVTRACLGSLLCHAALATLLWLVPITPPDLDAEEASNAVSVIMLGDADEDQAMAGAPQEIVAQEPVPERVTSQAVKPETLTAEPLTSEPLAPEPVQPENLAADIPQALAPVAPEVSTVPEPEVLTAIGPAETSIQQPEATPPAEISPVEPVPPVQEQVAALPEPAAMPVPEAKPEQKPPEAKVPRRDVAKKEKPQPDKPRAGGESGQASRKQTRGSDEGETAGRSAEMAQGSGRDSGAGDAVATRYGGKIRSIINRNKRKIKTETRGTAVVWISIDPSGGLSGLRIQKSSGDPGQDQALLNLIRTVAPFPEPPEAGGRSRYVFTLPVDFTR